MIYSSANYLIRATCCAGWAYPFLDEAFRLHRRRRHGFLTRAPGPRASGSAGARTRRLTEIMRARRTEPDWISARGIRNGQISALIARKAARGPLDHARRFAHSAALLAASPPARGMEPCAHAPSCPSRSIRCRWPGGASPPNWATGSSSIASRKRTDRPDQSFTRHVADELSPRTDRSMQNHTGSARRKKSSPGRPIGREQPDAHEEFGQRVVPGKARAAPDRPAVARPGTYITSASRAGRASPPHRHRSCGRGPCPARCRSRNRRSRPA